MPVSCSNFPWISEKTFTSSLLILQLIVPYSSTFNIKDTVLDQLLHRHINISSKRILNEKGLVSWYRGGGVTPCCRRDAVGAGGFIMADARMRFHLGVTEQWVWDLSPLFHEDVLKVSADHQRKNAPFLCASETSPLWKWRKLSVHHTYIGIFVEASIVKPYIGHIKLHLVLWIDRQWCKFDPLPVLL